MAIWLQRHDPRRDRGPDARHDALRRVMEWAAPAARPDRRQTLHRRRGRQVSLMLAPIVAACGAVVPMVSGVAWATPAARWTSWKPSRLRGPDPAWLRTTLRSAGCAIIGQTAELAPADRGSTPYATSRPRWKRAADHRQHPVQEARRRAAGPGAGRESGQRRLCRHARAWPPDWRESLVQVAGRRAAHACLASPT
jgi:hypothetical protein